MSMVIYMKGNPNEILEQEGGNAVKLVLSSVQASGNYLDILGAGEIELGEAYSENSGENNIIHVIGRRDSDDKFFIPALRSSLVQVRRICNERSIDVVAVLGAHLKSQKEEDTFVCTFKELFDGTGIKLIIAVKN